MGGAACGVVLQQTIPVDVVVAAGVNLHEQLCQLLARNVFAANHAFERGAELLHREALCVAGREALHDQPKVLPL